MGAMTDENPANNRLSAAGWLAIAILVALLAAALWYAAGIWRSLAGTHISGFGWTFMILGVVVTIALGAGLMGLVFYSSRHDMDR
jgi:hypothetical protein